MAHVELVEAWVTFKSVNGVKPHRKLRSGLIIHWRWAESLRRHCGKVLQAGFFRALGVRVVRSSVAKTISLAGSRTPLSREPSVCGIDDRRVY